MRLLKQLALLQWQKDSRHRLMLRHIRIKPHAPHEQRKIAQFLTAAWQPLRIQVGDGGMHAMRLTEIAGFAVNRHRAHTRP